MGSSPGRSDPWRRSRRKKGEEERGRDAAGDPRRSSSRSFPPSSSLLRKAADYDLDEAAAHDADADADTAGAGGHSCALASTPLLVFKEQTEVSLFGVSSPRSFPGAFSSAPKGGRWEKENCLAF